MDNILLIASSSLVIFSLVLYSKEEKSRPTELEMFDFITLPPIFFFSTIYLIFQSFFWIIPIVLLIFIAGKLALLVKSEDVELATNVSASVLILFVIIFGLLNLS